MSEVNAKNGTIKISKEVLMSIAESAAKETEGVADLSANLYNFKEYAKGKIPKSVSVTIKDGLAELDVGVVLKSMTKLNDVAENVQKNIKEAIQNMTGITVSKVNVIAVGVDFEEDSDIDKDKDKE